MKKLKLIALSMPLSILVSYNKTSSAKNLESVLYSIPWSNFNYCYSVDIFLLKKLKILSTKEKILHIFLMKSTKLFYMEIAILPLLSLVKKP